MLQATGSRRGRVSTARLAPVLMLCLAWAALAIGGYGCDARGRASAVGAPQASPGEASAAAAPQAGAAAPFDLGRVIRQVHFAFRPEGERFTGGHDTYAVSAGTDDLRFVPARPKAPAGALEAAPLVVSVSALERGGARLAGAAPLARVGKDATLSIDRGAAVEHLENTDDGVEQSFHFAERPAGSGDLVVRLRVSGEAYAGATESGLHFTDAASGLGVRYGAATWIDARGQRTAAPLAYEDGAITVTVPAAAVQDAAYPAVLDPVIGPEFAVDAPVPTTTSVGQGE